MTLQLYLGVEDVLLRRTGREKNEEAEFELLPHAMDFLHWASLEFRCHWLTRLDRSGGSEGVIKTFCRALGVLELRGELELLFCLVQPTYWENVKVEAIELDSDFKWIAHSPDQESLAVLKRRSLLDRLILCQEPHALVKIRCQLEPPVVAAFM